MAASAREPFLRKLDLLSGDTSKLLGRVVQGLDKLGDDLGRDYAKPRSEIAMDASTLRADVRVGFARLRDDAMMLRDEAAVEFGHVGLAERLDSAPSGRCARPEGRALMHGA